MEKKKNAPQTERSVPVDRSFEHAIISAERYALGRRTYIVEETVEYILRLLPALSDWCVSIIRRDLTSEFDLAERINDYRHLGNDCDIEDWKRLLKALEERAVRLEE